MCVCANWGGASHKQNKLSPGMARRTYMQEHGPVPASERVEHGGGRQTPFQNRRLLKRRHLGALKPGPAPECWIGDNECSLPFVRISHDSPDFGRPRQLGGNGSYGLRSLRAGIRRASQNPQQPPAARLVAAAKALHSLTQEVSQRSSGPGTLPARRSFKQRSQRETPNGS